MNKKKNPTTVYQDIPVSGSASASAADPAKKRTAGVYPLVLCGVFAAVMVICSQILIPLPSGVPINLAILGVLLCAGCLGFRYGMITQIIYVLLGCIGIPVFAGLSGGLHVIAGPTGGYIVGYILCAGVVGFIASRTRSFWALVGAMILGVLVCYAFGTIWYVHLMNISFAAGLAQCVIPFLPFDAAKIALAALLVQRLRQTKLVKL